MQILAQKLVSVLKIPDSVAASSLIRSRWVIVISFHEGHRCNLKIMLTDVTNFIVCVIMGIYLAVKSEPDEISVFNIDIALHCVLAIIEIVAILVMGLFLILI